MGARYLIDNQLPRSLAEHLRGCGLSAEHVRDLGLGQADDATIARTATANDLTIITKDEDFVHWSDLHGGPPIIWVRLGNCRNHALFEAFDRHRPALEAAARDGIRILELDG